MFAGPVVWDHFFHGETYDASLPLEWQGGGKVRDTSTTTTTTTDDDDDGQAWAPAQEVTPLATAATGMQVVVDSKAVALGELKPSQSPPLRVQMRFSALTVKAVNANDVGPAFVFDFGENMAGMVQINLPAGHSVPKGTVLRIEHAEIVQGKDTDISGMCALCPGCSSCRKGGGGGASGPSGKGSCDSRGASAACDTYCNNPSLERNVTDDHPLRHEPCFPHQSYSPGFPAGAPGPWLTP